MRGERWHSLEKETNKNWIILKDRKKKAFQKSLLEKKASTANSLKIAMVEEKRKPGPRARKNPWKGGGEEKGKSCRGGEGVRRKGPFADSGKKKKKR